MFFIVKRWNYHPHNRMRNLHVGFEQHPKHTIYSGGIVLCLSKPSLKDKIFVRVEWLKPFGLLVVNTTKNSASVIWEAYSWSLFHWGFLVEEGDIRQAYLTHKYKGGIKSNQGIDINATTVAQ